MSAKTSPRKLKKQRHRLSHLTPQAQITPHGRDSPRNAAAAALARRTTSIRAVAAVPAYTADAAPTHTTAATTPHGRRDKPARGRRGQHRTQAQQHRHRTDSLRAKCTARCYPIKQNNRHTGNGRRLLKIGTMRGQSVYCTNPACGHCQRILRTNGSRIKTVPTKTTSSDGATPSDRVLRLRAGVHR